MAASNNQHSSEPNSAAYHRLNSDPPPRPTTTYTPTRPYCICLTTITAVLLLSISIFILYPSNPEISIANLHLESLQFHTSPKISVDMSLNLTVKVYNSNVYSIEYDSLNVSIAYNEKVLGFVASDDDGGIIKARGTSYIDVNLDLDGVEVLDDVVPLIEDLAKGSVTFDTQTEIDGSLGLAFFHIPLQATISCEIVVDSSNRTVSQQNCYPEI